MIDGTLAYIVNSAAWAFVGAALVVIYQKAPKARRSPVFKDRLRRLKPNWIQAIAVALLLFSVAATVVSWNTDRHQREFVACQAKVNQARTEALDELSAIGVEDRKAVDDLVFAVTEAKDRTSIQVAFANYRSTRARLETERNQHPLPQPSGLCGEIPPK